MIGGINSSMQNRIALVDERFISEALSSFDADHAHCPSDRSAERFHSHERLLLLYQVAHLMKDREWVAKCALG